MFQCVLYKNICLFKDKDNLHSRLVKEIKLPFPPYKGLEILREGKVESVIWDNRDNQFIVLTQDIFVERDQDLTVISVAQKHVEHYKQNCWEEDHSSDYFNIMRQV